MTGARLDGRDRVRYAAARVVVRVDPDVRGAGERGDRGLGGGGDLAGQRRAVRVAQDDRLGACLSRRAQAPERVLAVVAKGVEEVLGVVHDALAASAQERDGVRDHRQVLVPPDARHLVEVERPRLADERAYGHERLGEQP